MKSCPFKAGDLVVYRPNDRGIALSMMERQKLVPGHAYRIKEIQKAAYVLVEGYTHPGGGIYWTEFTQP